MDVAIFHICDRAALESARRAGEYRAASLEREGFIHLSRGHQVHRTAAAYFAGVPDLVVLIVDPTRLTARLVYEAPAPPQRADGRPVTPTAHGDDLYPHCYGPINLSAILDAIDLERFDGTSGLPFSTGSASQ